MSPAKEGTTAVITMQRVREPAAEHRFTNLRGEVDGRLQRFGQIAAILRW
jgi:hypothetical protein